MSVLDEVFATIRKRKERPSEDSYVSGLMEKGGNAVLKKIGEETVEFAASFTSDDKEAMVHEAADLIFHTQIALAFRDVDWTDVLAEYKRRKK